MIYRKIERIGIEVSLVSMGGHEYLPDGRSRGFNEDFALATRPGYIFEGFGQESRKEVLRIAYEHGINFFDVTQDSDPFNQSMADYAKLEAEVQRGLRLLRQIRSGHFDAINLNLNFADAGGVRTVMPAAAARGMGVFSREAFMTVGTNNAEHLRGNLAVLGDLRFSEEELALIERVRTSSRFKRYAERKTREFFGET